MPDKSSHLNFARLYLSMAKEKYNSSAFILGALAPDLVYELEIELDYNDDEIKKYHFLDDDKNIDLIKFIKKTDISKTTDKLKKSFLIGYYCHLWYDNYFSYNSDKLIDSSIDSTEKKNVAVKNIKFYNVKASKEYFDTLVIKNDHKDLDTFEFITFERVYDSYKKFREETKQMLENDAIILDKEKYEYFLNEAVLKFAEEVDHFEKQ
ncbi:hypothetical protein [Brassicibacter mesophilus]|uniref:hypothetical protein n=1 Tax=Brassicibacter mesophilus TaxID=745119 RepID=UPI003D1D1206